MFCIRGIITKACTFSVLVQDVPGIASHTVEKIILGASWQVEETVPIDQACVSRTLHALGIDKLEATLGTTGLDPQQGQQQEQQELGEGPWCRVREPDCLGFEFHGREVDRRLELLAK